LTILQHQEADRIPLAVGGGSYGIVDELYLKLVQKLELGDPVTPFRQGHTISYMDDRLLEKLGVDFRYVWPGLLPNSPVNPGEDEYTFYDSYGQVWQRAKPYYYTGRGLLADASSLDDIDRLVRWPDLSDPRWAAGVAERAAFLRQQTDYFVVMRMVASHGPFQTACDLRGTDQFLMDMVMKPDFALALLDRITSIQEGLLRLALRAGGQYFDMIELPGDDYAGNRNTLVSPAMFRRFIKPCLARLIGIIRSEYPQMKVMLHSDGAITSLIPEFIALGIDVIHPLEPLEATDQAAVKQQYGSKVTFLGGIDISHALQGSREQVVAEVKRRISQLGAGGGYILAPSNHLQADIPAENVITLFQAAQEFGRYPLQLE
jgi:uroporphyrinogen decarboxylase